MVLILMGSREGLHHPCTTANIFVWYRSRRLFVYGCLGLFKQIYFKSCIYISGGRLSVCMSVCVFSSSEAIGNELKGHEGFPRSTQCHWIKTLRLSPFLLIWSRDDQSLLSLWSWKSIPSRHFLFILFYLSFFHSLKISLGTLSPYVLTCTPCLSSYIPTYKLLTYLPPYLPLSVMPTFHSVHPPLYLPSSLSLHLPFS